MRSRQINVMLALRYLIWTMMSRTNSIVNLLTWKYNYQYKIRSNKINNLSLISIRIYYKIQHKQVTKHKISQFIISLLLMIYGSYNNKYYIYV